MASRRCVLVAVVVRQLAASFVAVPPSGTSTQTRLLVTEVEDAVLWELYRFGGRLRASDLRRLVEMNAAGAGIDAGSVKALTAARKRDMTPRWSSRMAGAVYRNSDELWALAMRNMVAHIDTLDERIAAISERLEIPVGAKGGYRNHRTADAKRYRLECAARKRDQAQAKLDANRPSICLGGKDLARCRHNLKDAGLTVEEWRHRHDAARGWLAVNGTTGEVLGNQTMRVDPGNGTFEVLLPPELAHLSNTAGPRRSWRLEAPVGFEHLGEEWAARAVSRRSIRYELDYRFPQRNKAGGWYLVASWSYDQNPLPELSALRSHSTLAVDLNSDHVACCVVDAQGNPVGRPFDIAVLKEHEHSDWTIGQKDANIRNVVQQIIAAALVHGCGSICIEDLNFSKHRKRGRDTRRLGKKTRKTVLGMPTAVFRDRLVAMAHNARRSVWVIAVDPAYTSVLGRSHWLPILKTSFSKNCTSHHGAAVVIGRRGLGFLARRSISVHEAEQKSQKRCFNRSGSIQTRASDKTAHTPASKQPAPTPEVAKHTAEPTERAHGPPGGNKPFHPAEPPNNITHPLVHTNTNRNLNGWPLREYRWSC